MSQNKFIDAEGRWITSDILLHAWSESINETTIDGKINWRKAEIRSHPFQRAALETLYFQEKTLPENVGRFFKQANWYVDRAYPKDFVEVQASKKDRTVTITNLYRK